jgi:hypothetical protein
MVTYLGLCSLQLISIDVSKGMTRVVVMSNIKIYDTGTMFINKRSGNLFEFAKELGFKVITYLLNQMISGEIKTEDVDKLRIKKPVETNEDSNVRKISASTARLLGCVCMSVGTPAMQTRG